MQMREKVRKSRHALFFQWIWGSGGSKSRLPKAAGAEPAGQMRDEKVHAVVARSTFRSQVKIYKTHIFYEQLQQNKTLTSWKKRHLESFLKFTSHRPYKAISWTYGEILHVESFFKIGPPRPYKANGWTNAENWHVGLFLKFITSCRLPKAAPAIYEQSWHVESLFWSLNVLPPSPPHPF